MQNTSHISFAFRIRTYAVWWRWTRKMWRKDLKLSTVNTKQAA